MLTPIATETPTAQRVGLSIEETANFVAAAYSVSGDPFLPTPRVTECLHVEEILNRLRSLNQFESYPKN